MKPLGVVLILLLTACLGCQSLPMKVFDTGFANRSVAETTGVEDPQPQLRQQPEIQIHPNLDRQNTKLLESTDELSIDEVSRNNDPKFEHFAIPASPIVAASVNHSNGPPAHQPFAFRFAGTWKASRPLVILGQDAFTEDQPPAADSSLTTPISIGLDSDDILPGMDRLSEYELADTFDFHKGVVQDYRNFCSRPSLQFLGTGFLFGAAMAHSDADQEVYDWMYDGLNRSENRSWHQFLHSTKDLGDGRYTLPVFAGCWVVGELFEDSNVANQAGKWGGRSIRGFIVGAPFVAVTQMATGAGRPGERSSGSAWRPFEDENGVSGHSYMGALPWITAAMMTDDLRLKTGLYLASLATPLSRISDGAHYPSQVVLGWWAAYAAARSVAQTDQQEEGDFDVRPYVNEAGDSGLMFEWDF